MERTWGPEKNDENGHKHRILFETARLVFDDPLHVAVEDPHEDKPRSRPCGLIGQVLVLVVHTCEQRAELAALAELREDQIDNIDIPEVLDSHACRANLYRPTKQQITLRMDADVVAWSKEQAPAGCGYQTNINRALREHVDRTSRHETVSAA